MNTPFKDFSYSLKDAFIAYCLTISTAAISFSLLFVGFSLLSRGFETATPLDFFTRASHFLILTLIIICIGWVGAFITAFIPYCAAIFVARRYAITHWTYFVSGSFLFAALLCIVHAYEWQQGPPLGPVPDKIPTLLESYLHLCPFYWSSGILAGLVCWQYLCRKRVVL
jgi:hypothetical protein